MKNRRFRFHLLLLFLSSVLLGRARLAADSTQPIESDAPPYVGVVAYGKPSDADAYAKWLNRSAIWVHFNPPAICKTWDALDAALVIGPEWGTWVRAVQGRRVVISVPLLPADGSTLAIAATGKYNNHFATLAKKLVANHLGNAIICMGPTLGWKVPWKFTHKDDPANFILYWKQVVQTIRSVPGADKIQFDWIGEGGPKYSMTNGYPGDDTVDFIATSIWEGGAGDRRIYPYPPNASASERLYHNKLAWKLVALPTLRFWADFAKNHGKPMSIICWGMGADHTSSSGADVPYHVQMMHDFIQDPANNVYFSTDCENYDFGFFRTHGFAKATAKYQEVFGLKPTTQASTSPSVPQ